MGRVAARRARVLEVLAWPITATARDVSAWMPLVSTTTASRDLAHLERLGLVERMGRDSDQTGQPVLYRRK